MNTYAGRQNKGIFQLKIARTSKFVVDKLQAKMSDKKERRPRGGNLDVEREGQSGL